MIFPDSSANLIASLSGSLRITTLSGGRTSILSGRTSGTLPPLLETDKLYKLVLTLFSLLVFRESFNLSFSISTFLKSDWDNLVSRSASALRILACPSSHEISLQQLSILDCHCSLSDSYWDNSWVISFSNSGVRFSPSRLSSFSWSRENSVSSWYRFILLARTPCVLSNIASSPVLSG